MILLTGATGFIGNRVLQELSKKNLKVRCLVRKPASSKNPNITYATGDVLDYESLSRATAGVETAYYFIHMMGNQPAGKQKKFDELDRLAINNMVRACRQNGVKRIIHLTGIRNPRERLSRHLESRKEVEEIIRNSGIDYTIFRASIIIGKGGAAFDILETAVHKFPIIPIFDWENTMVQPVYIDDVIRYLVECLDRKETLNKCFDIGCSEVFTYKELIQQYAGEIGLKRFFIRIPGAWHWISAKVLGKLSPVNPNVVYWLIESLQNNMVCEPSDLNKIFGFKTIGFRESIRKLLVDKQDQN